MRVRSGRSSLDIFAVAVLLSTLLFPVPYAVIASLQSSVFGGEVTAWLLHMLPGQQTAFDCADLRNAFTLNYLSGFVLAMCRHPAAEE